MNYHEIKLIDFGFHYRKINNFRNSQMALRVAKGESLKSIGKDYNVTGSTVRNAYQRIFRIIYRRIENCYREMFHESDLNELWDKQFKTPLGILLIENYLSHIPGPPDSNFLSKPYEEDESYKQLLNPKIDDILNRLEKKKQSLVAEIECYFDKTKKWVEELRDIKVSE